jgi:hypothetical protein
MRTEAAAAVAPDEAATCAVAIDCGRLSVVTSARKLRCRKSKQKCAVSSDVIATTSRGQWSVSSRPATHNPVGQTTGAG